MSLWNWNLGLNRWGILVRIWFPPPLKYKNRIRDLNGKKHGLFNVRNSLALQNTSASEYWIKIDQRTSSTEKFGTKWWPLSMILEQNFFLFFNAAMRIEWTSLTQRSWFSHARKAPCHERVRRLLLSGVLCCRHYLHHFEENWHANVYSLNARSL